jgi:DNA-directed RNA polymerase alpha subunit
MNKLFISCKESRIENNRSFYGCFYIGPFDEVQSLTIANALRRTLLSDCTGLGITSVTIENANHEYATLPGVRESVLDIILNLKEIVLKKTTNTCTPVGLNARHWSTYKNKGISSIYEQVGASYFRPVIGYLKVKGPGVVRSKDLRLPAFVQCVDPDQYIATLADDGFLCMKFVIMEGKGYLIQKNDTFVDSTLVNKRRELLNQLKELTQKTIPLPSENKGNSLSSSLKKEKIEESKAIKKNASDLSQSLDLVSPLEIQAQQRENVKLKKGMKSASSRFAQKNSDKQNLFMNATPLNIDTVFNPVTKVNYIIEANENYLVDSLHKKTTFIDEISSLLESSKYLKTNFPFLNNVVSSETLNEKEITNIIDTLSTSEFNFLANSMHPLKRESTPHTILLEIWTNGSLHPRDALSIGLNNLTSVFLNLTNTKVYNPIYTSTALYKKSTLKDSYDSTTAAVAPLRSAQSKEGKNHN